MLTIKDRVEPEQVPIDGTKYGQLFAFADCTGKRYYMRTKNTHARDNEIYAVDLEAGDVVFFSSGTYIIPVTGELLIR
jgi:hypothetical protein